jgi:hypothetical protein
MGGILRRAFGVDPPASTAGVSDGGDAVSGDVVEALSPAQQQALAEEAAQDNNARLARKSKGGTPDAAARRKSRRRSSGGTPARSSNGPGSGSQGKWNRPTPAASSVLNAAALANVEEDFDVEEVDLPPAVVTSVAPDGTPTSRRASGRDSASNPASPPQAQAAGEPDSSRRASLPEALLNPWHKVSFLLA